MRYYPIYLDVQGRVCLIVGGGAVGTRKAETILKAGAQVTVVSPEVTPRLAALAKADQIRLHRRPYTRRDMEGIFLVFGTTDDRDLNRRVSEDANRLKVLCNIADQPDRGQFILPAVVQRGDLLISVSTSGKSPALARRIRRQIENTYDTEYARMLDLLGALRRRLLDQGRDPRGHKKLFEALLDSDLLEWIKAGDTVRIDQFLHQHFGETFAWKDLMAPTQ
ncbi:MAG: bifunctional precorrin-2 dehydrogenase/sirohydrochlorin ferrochelatase [Desulfosarcina sp.]|nr:bifunctional precorrin-2 dehydrogenase/sirohydrochlorin ferrochelatase [Desulfobacterales bacterium]